MARRRCERGASAPVGGLILHHTVRRVVELDAGLMLEKRQVSAGRPGCWRRASKG
jgi:hypothetical protein